MPVPGVVLAPGGQDEHRTGSADPDLRTVDAVLRHVPRHVLVVAGIVVESQREAVVVQQDSENVERPIGLAPVLPARKLDDGEPAVVDEAVHVHVAQACEVDRDLGPQDPGGDLGHLGLGLLLLLAHQRATVLDRPVK